MFKGKKFFFVVVFLFLAGIVAWKIVANNAPSDTRRQIAPLVKVEHPRRETVLYQLKFTGDIAAAQSANIFSKVSGNLDRVYVDIGTQVVRGQALALIDTTELVQQLRLTSATYQNSTLNYQRTKELLEQNLVAKQDLDNSETAMKIAKANYDAAATRLSYSTILAPFKGYITKRFLDQGANVTSNNLTLFTIMDLDEVKVIVNVLEKDIPRIFIGKEALITVDAFPGEIFSGKITRLSQAVDLSTRTMAVEIDVPNPNHRLKPGMFANITLTVDQHQNALTVPIQSVLKDEKGSFIFTVDNKVARKKSVTVNEELNGRSEVVSGLDGTEFIIVTGQQFVKDGSAVTIQQ